MTYKIVMDSSSNLQEMPSVNFASVALKIIAGEREFIDDPHLNLQEMLDYLADYKDKSSTSSPNVYDWLEAFGEADAIFVPTITSNLSGTYSSANLARDIYQEIHPNRHVCTLDTLSTGPEMVLIAEKLAEMILAEETFNTIEARIHAYMQHTHLLFSLEHLDNMAKNGRVNPMVAKAAGLLGIRIIGRASDEGTLQPLGKARGERKAISQLYDEMKKNYRGGKVRIAHCFNAAAAQALMRLLKADFPESDVTIGATTALCSFYAETGGLLVGYEDC